MRIKGIVSALSLFTVIAGCSSEPSQHYVYHQNILGPWDCNYSFKEDDITVSISSTDSYIRNGASNSFGIMKIRYANGMPEIEYSVAGTATWKIQGKYLIQTMTDVKIVNVSHPGMDEIFNLQEMFPTNISESSEILKLTPTELVLDSESGAGLYTCSKASKPKV
ncbi:MAG: hypothetical protein ACN6P1_20850 [Pseudomonas sp.]|uniref:hypothetical protein n=1 Tax=Pseudomonas sp. TaxID=306 RepID=UPI003D0BC8AF